ncbi:high-affinity iron permease [Sporothrix curviconia]|uniref:High-affinity iron permease n=1 Tax=Sporothrix curviconia TaxID=1260050 RepID=A0ABP0AQR1_9PEZI
MTVDVFSVPVFLVVFRESLETVIIVSVLLAFLKQTLGQDGIPAENDDNARNTPYRRLVRQVWTGTLTGLLLCICIASIIIAIFYTVGTDHWAASEENYEGAFALVASLIISVVGAALLRIGRMQQKWRVKLATALRRRGEHREGIEAIVFVAGVSFSAPARSVPLPVIVGLLAGIAVGYLLYKGGSSARLQVFLVASTALLYLVAAGLFSRAIWSFEMQVWNSIVGADAAELGSGPGSYDIDRSVWHVNCCNPELNGGGGWGFFNAVLGWTNSATYGSVLAYNLYWLTAMIAFGALRYREVRGYWPLPWAKRTKARSSGAAQQPDPRLPDIAPLSPLRAPAPVVEEIVSEKAA